MRQALFDMLMHAPWAAGGIQGAAVADIFAGTGALGLEALSRGAASCVFVEQDRAALAALRANIAACRAGETARVLAQDALRVAKGPACDLVFLDPPYGQALVTRAVTALTTAGWITPTTLIASETGRDEALELSAEPLAERAHGAARVTIWRPAA